MAVFERFLNELFPVSCLACGHFGIWACPDHLPEPAFPDPLPGFRSVVSAGPYDDEAMGLLVRGLKFSGYREVGRLLGLLLAPRLREVVSVSDASRVVLAPVPLSRWRQNKRGFNQAEEIAAGIALETGWPVFPRALKRKHRRPQSDLDRSERLKNVRGAFSVRNAEVLHEHVVVFVDDVFTTGATLSACRDACVSVGVRGPFLAGTAAFRQLKSPGVVDARTMNRT